MATRIKELGYFSKCLVVVALVIAYLVPVYWLVNRLELSGMAGVLVVAGLLQLDVWAYRKTTLSHWLKFGSKGAV